MRQDRSHPRRALPLPRRPRPAQPEADRRGGPGHRQGVPGPAGPGRPDPRSRCIGQEISDRRARLHRAQQDYDSEIIEGVDLKRIRDRERPAIEALEREKLAQSAGTDLGPVAAAPDPVAEFDALDLVGRRAVIDALCEVRLHRGVRGSRVFDSDSVDIIWRAD